MNKKNIGRLKQKFNNRRTKYVISTEFKDGVLKVTCMKAEPTLAVVEVDGMVWLVPFAGGVGIQKARVMWEPESVRVIGLGYVAIEKAEKKPLKQGEHRSPPKGYPRKQSDYAGPHYDFPINTAEHVRAALSYFTKHKWGAGERGPAAKRIIRAAHRFGIKVSPDSAVARAAHGRK